MNLKTKRNIPLVLLFVTFITMLIIMIGSAPIVAYTIQ